MRLKKSDRAQVAKTVCNEKFYPQALELARKMKDKAEEIANIIYPKKDWVGVETAKMYGLRFGPLRLEALHIFYSLPVVTACESALERVYRWCEENTFKACSETEIPTGAETEGVPRWVVKEYPVFVTAMEEFQEINGQLLQLDKEAQNLYSEVLGFLQQFTTYKKALAEWSDLSKYLDDRSVPAKKKGAGTALMITGKEFKRKLFNAGR